MTPNIKSPSMKTSRVLKCRFWEEKHHEGRPRQGEDEPPQPGTMPVRARNNTWEHFGSCKRHITWQSGQSGASCDHPVAFKNLCMRTLGMLIILGDTFFFGSLSHWLGCSAEWQRHCKLSIENTEDTLSLIMLSAVCPLWFIGNEINHADCTLCCHRWCVT